MTIVIVGLICAVVLTIFTLPTALSRLEPGWSYLLLFAEVLLALTITIAGGHNRRVRSLMFALSEGRELTIEQTFMAGMVIYFGILVVMTVLGCALAATRE